MNDITFYVYDIVTYMDDISAHVNDIHLHLNDNFFQRWRNESVDSKWTELERAGGLEW